MHVVQIGRVVVVYPTMDTPHRYRDPAGAGSGWLQHQRSTRSLCSLSSVHPQDLIPQQAGPACESPSPACGGALPQSRAGRRVSAPPCRPRVGPRGLGAFLPVGQSVWGSPRFLRGALVLSLLTCSRASLVLIRLLSQGAWAPEEN